MAPKVTLYASSMAATTKMKYEQDRLRFVLHAKKIPFTEVDVSEDQVARREMLRVSDGQKGLPQLHADGRFIGLFGEIQELVDFGELEMVIEGRDPAAEAMRVAEEQARLEAEQARLEAELARRAEAKKAEEARAAEEARKAAEAKAAEEAKKAEEARLAEEGRKVEQARKAEELRQLEQARKAEETRKAEEARVIEVARQADEARKAEEARLVEEARLADEAEGVDDTLTSELEDLADELDVDDTLDELLHEADEEDSTEMTAGSSGAAAVLSSVAVVASVGGKAAEEPSACESQDDSLFHSILAETEPCSDEESFDGSPHGTASGETAGQNGVDGVLHRGVENEQQLGATLLPTPVVQLLPHTVQARSMTSDSNEHKAENGVPGSTDRGGEESSGTAVTAPVAQLLAHAVSTTSIASTGDVEKERNGVCRAADRNGEQLHETASSAAAAQLMAHAVSTQSMSSIRDGGDAESTALDAAKPRGLVPGALPSAASTSASAKIVDLVGETGDKSRPGEVVRVSCPTQLMSAAPTQSARYEEYTPDCTPEPPSAPTEQARSRYGADPYGSPTPSPYPEGHSVGEEEDDMEEEEEAVAGVLTPEPVSSTVQGGRYTITAFASPEPSPFMDKREAVEAEEEEGEEEEDEGYASARSASPISAARGAMLNTAARVDLLVGRYADSTPGASPAPERVSEEGGVCEEGLGEDECGTGRDGDALEEGSWDADTTAEESFLADRGEGVRETGVAGVREAEGGGGVVESEKASFDLVPSDVGKVAAVPFSEWLKASEGLLEREEREEEEAVDARTDLSSSASKVVPFSEWLRSQGEELDELDAEEEAPMAVEPMPRQAMPFSEWLKLQDAS